MRHFSVIFENAIARCAEWWSAVSYTHLDVYKRQVYNGRGVLATVSSDGRVKQRLGAGNADVREPAWGPLPR